MLWGREFRSFPACPIWGTKGYSSLYWIGQRATSPSITGQSAVRSISWIRTHHLRFGVQSIGTDLFFFRTGYCALWPIESKSIPSAPRSNNSLSPQQPMVMGTDSENSSCGKCVRIKRKSAVFKSTLRLGFLLHKCLFYRTCSVIASVLYGDRSLSGDWQFIEIVVCQWPPAVGASWIFFLKKPNNKW